MGLLPIKNVLCVGHDESVWGGAISDLYPREPTPVGVSPSTTRRPRHAAWKPATQVGARQYRVYGTTRRLLRERRAIGQRGERHAHVPFPPIRGWTTDELVVVGEWPRPPTPTRPSPRGSRLPGNRSCPRPRHSAWPDPTAPVATAKTGQSTVPGGLIRSWAARNAARRAWLLGHRATHVPSRTAPVAGASMRPLAVPARRTARACGGGRHGSHRHCPNSTRPA
jgi:hypothetical protein